MRKYHDYDWLFRQYVTKGRLVEEIAEDGGCRVRAIRDWIKKFGLVRRRPGSYSVNEDFFRKIDEEKKAYWLGFIAADGCVQNEPKKRLLTITLSKKDADHLERFRQDIQCEKKCYNRKDGNVQLDIVSKKMVGDLIRCGIVPRKSKILKPPQIKKSLTHHWIRGYFDGDGSISLCYDGNKRGSVFGTEEVMGFLMEYWPNKQKIRCRNGGFEFSFGGNHAVSKVADFLYKGASVFLQRKHQVFRIEV